MTPVMLLAAALAAAPVPKTVTAGPGDWPQWRGPNRDGKSNETGLLKVWPEGGPKLVWEKKDVGTGYGSPAVVGGKMYLLGGAGNKAGDGEWLSCLSAKDGQPVWKTAFDTTPGKFLDGWGGGPRGTPTVDGEFVYALGATGDVVCLKTADGSKVWTKNLVKDFGGGVPQWGYSESVLIDGDKLVCTPGKGTGMVALNKMTGETYWACKDFSDGAGYSSIMIAEVGGVRQYVTQTMAKAVGVAADSGKLLWKAGEIKRATAVIPSPVLADGYAFFTSGYGAGCECFKLEPDGAGTKATIVFTKLKTLANHHGGVVQVGDYIYGHSDSGGWTCLPFKKESPEAAWQSQKLGKGSVTFADGYLYCYAEGDGTLARVKPSPTDAWAEEGRFKIPELSKARPKSGKVWAHPVIAGGKLYLRDYDLLFCYDVAGK